MIRIVSVRAPVAHVLVTGGLGFIGSRLSLALLEEGLAVRVVDDLSGSYSAGTGPAARAALAERGAEVIVEPAEPDHARGADAVIHLAALPGVRTRRSPDELRASNVDLADGLALAAAERSARFLLVSSSSVYGNAAELPTPEDAPAAPLNAYAESKVAAEAAVLASGADAVIVRPFTVYGPGQRPEMAFARWIEALGAGDPVPWHAPPGTARDFTYVGDAVAGIVAALRRGRAGEAYNLSGWRPVDLLEALELLAGPERAEVRELPSGAAEAHRTHGCGRKAAAELGYAPRVDLATGLERQLAALSPSSLCPSRGPSRGRPPRRLAA
jgi:UDP-glucuronate 4-epimerase